MMLSRSEGVQPPIGANGLYPTRHGLQGGRVRPPPCPMKPQPAPRIPNPPSGPLRSAQRQHELSATHSRNPGGRLDPLTHHCDPKGVNNDHTGVGLLRLLS